jgi:hypothetical protein
MRFKWSVFPLLLLLLVSLLGPAAVSAAPVATPTIIGQVGGASNAVVYGGGQLYVNIGPRLIRLAAANLAAPGLPPTFGPILPGIPEDLELANGYLYAALGREGVAIIDTQTLQPVASRLLPGGAFAAAVAVGSQRLYVAAGDAGIFA